MIPNTQFGTCAGCSSSCACVTPACWKFFSLQAADWLACPLLGCESIGQTEYSGWSSWGLLSCSQVIFYNYGAPDGTDYCVSCDDSFSPSISPGAQPLSQFGTYVAGTNVNPDPTYYFNYFSFGKAQFTGPSDPFCVAITVNTATSSATTYYQYDALAPGQTVEFDSFALGGGGAGITVLSGYTCGLCPSGEGEDPP
jgi:hypothetical protein